MGLFFYRTCDGLTFNSIDGRNIMFFALKSVGRALEILKCFSVKKETDAGVFPSSK